MRLTLIIVMGLAGFTTYACADQKMDLPIPASLSITPAEFTIHGADNVQRMLVFGKNPK